MIWWEHVSQWALHGLLIRSPVAVLWMLKDLFSPWKIHFMLPVLPSHACGILFLAYFFITGSFILTVKTKKATWGFIFLSLLSIWLAHITSNRFNGGWAYFPLLWITLAFGSGLEKVCFPKGSPAILLFICLLILFTLLFGVNLHREREWKNTNSLLSDSLRSSPSDPFLLALMGHYRAAMGNTRGMQKVFNRIKEANAPILCLEAKAYHLAMEFSQSDHLFTKLFQLYPEKRRDTFCLFDFAVLKIQQGAYGRAESLFKKILQLDPFFIYASHNLGTLLLQEKRQEGVGDLKRVLEISPAYHPTLENLAFYFMRHGKWNQAIHFLNIAAETTSCKDTLRYYREWIHVMKAKTAFPYASLQWAKLRPPS